MTALLTLVAALCVLCSFFVICAVVAGARADRADQFSRDVSEGDCRLASFFRDGGH